MKIMESSLSEDDMLFASSELNEPKSVDERLEKIDQLRTAFLNQNAELCLIRSDDAFILRFLRARKFHRGYALSILNNYHAQYCMWPEVLEKMNNPQLVKYVFDAGGYITLKGKAKDGSAICIGRPGRTENFDAVDFFAAMLLTLEKLLDDEKVQIYGITVIEDVSNVGYKIAWKFPSLSKQVMSLMQDVMPLRLRSINFVNEPYLFDCIAMIMKPFFKEKMRKRMHLHGKKFSKLHELIDPSILPPMYGGTSAFLDGEVSDLWKKIIF